MSQPHNSVVTPERKESAVGAAATSRAAELALVIFFLVLLASGGVIQLVSEIGRGERVSALEVFRQRPTSANLRAYEHGLEDASIVAKALRPQFQFAQFRWLRDGGEKALVGRDGWLFYKPGFDDMVRRVETSTNDAVAAIVAWRDALAARGIDLGGCSGAKQGEHLSGFFEQSREAGRCCGFAIDTRFDCPP